MSKIWDLQQHKGKTALIDELGNQMNYDVLNSEANILSERIGHRCLVFALCRNEIGSVLGYTASSGSSSEPSGNIQPGVSVASQRPGRAVCRNER